MSSDLTRSGKSTELRLRAERVLGGQPAAADLTDPGVHNQRLLHELQVHQIELEMQNEELRESRAHMEAALERSIDLYDFAPVGYFTLSSDGTIRELNLPASRLLGLERARLVGGRFRIFVSAPTRSIFDSWLKEVFSSQSKQSCNLELINQGKSTVPVEMEATLSLDGLEARIVASDITLRKSLEDQLRHAQKMEMIGQLAGGVAHDFNNILGAMLLNLEMALMQQSLSPESQSSLHNLEVLAKRAASLTQQLLLFSRRQAMQPVQLEINAALAHLLKMLERLLGEDITCHRISSPQELWVEADAGMLDQAVMNLCLNARDAMPLGGTLGLETSLVEFTADHAQSDPESRPGKFACIHISDTGCGMDAEVLKHAFEPFFTTKEIGKGTGLGLASAYGVMHQHQGWVTVESIVGQGTSFRLFFPLSANADVSHVETPQKSFEKGKNETILVVEDEAALLFISTRALTMLGYQVLSATNGMEALEIWHQRGDDIDLVVTDMRMPKGLSGLELAEELWKSKPSLKIIIMSGYSLEIAQTSLVGERGYTFLAKPFDIKALSETVKKCLRHPSP